ncbi:MAG: hypothetical protein A2Y10_03640 [Planctomycetes bacterium GWF2_41_51]|nr:MAG: hypothetical protein A2Y10_03640 [Planctomycetes bacterium GWF2_41_51]HBG28836.1 hypothetical protein [Phycisphaerales bacterium]
MSKNAFYVLVLSFLFAVNNLNAGANNCQWYDDSYIHSHISLNLPASDIDFVIKQIQDAKVDAVQFHTHDNELWQLIDKRNLAEKIGFKKVATINHAGVWYEGEANFLRKSYNGRAGYQYRINPDGSFAGRWTRKHICFNSPAVYSEIIPTFYYDLVKQLQPDQVWIDEAIITVNLCYCKYCTDLFKQQYKMEPPTKLTDKNHNKWVKWVDFHRDTFRKWMETVYESIQKAKPDTLVTFNHSYYIEQPEEPPYFVKNLSGDIHKDTLELGLYARYGGSSDLPFDLMPGLGDDTWAGVKPKTAEQIYNDISIIIAHGGRWNIGEYPTNFTALRSEPKFQGPGYRRADLYLDLAVKGSKFAYDRKEFCVNTKSVPYAAMLHSAKTHYSHVIVNANKITEDNELRKTTDGDFQKNEKGKVNSRIYWPDHKFIYDDLLGAYQSLLENHIQFDIIAEYQLQKKLEDYKLLVLAEQTYLEEATIAKIKSFVADGGHIIASGSTIAAGMEDVLGLNANWTKAAPEQIDLSKQKLILDNVWQVNTANAEVVKKYQDSNLPFVTKNVYGKGTAIYISGDIFKQYFKSSGYSHEIKGEDDNLRYFIGELLDSCLAKGDIKFKADPWIEIALRENNGNVYLHIINRDINWRQRKESSLGKIEAEIRLNFTPKQIRLQPGNENIDYSIDDKTIKLSLEQEKIDFHKIVQISK